jgi:TetR/AcrR family transcriptional regulator, transcriptional repressor for nem operon
MNDTREFIIDQAFELFLTRSYEAVSINDISQAIGFTKGALYHHFLNKEELFKAVIDKYLEFPEIEDDINKISLKEFNASLLSNVRKVMDRLFGNKIKYVPINYLTIIADGFRHYQGFAGEKERYFNSEINKTKQVLDNAIKKGEIRNDINTSVMAMTYFSSAIGLAGNLLQNYSVDESMDALKAQLDELYKLLKI